MTKWMLAAVLVLSVTGVSAKEQKHVKRVAPKVASGQVICSQAGCRPVAPGCHIEARVYMGMSATNLVEVCK